MTEEDFFSQIVALTRNANQRATLTEHNQQIYEMILRDYRRNIRLAAARGNSRAFICIYEPSAIGPGGAPIDAFVRMNDNMIAKHREYLLTSVLDRVRQKLHPFRVEVRQLDEAKKELIGILVSWDSQIIDT